MGVTLHLPPLLYTLKPQTADNHVLESQLWGKREKKKRKKKNTQLVHFFTEASLKLELDIQGSGPSLTATHLHLVSARLESTPVKVHQVNI